MAEPVEYELTLKDLFTEKLNKAKEAAESFGEVIERVKKVAETFGIDASVLDPAEFIKKGIEGVHKLHEAEAQLQNTLQNTGKYSEESFEKMVKGAGNLSEHVNYSKAQIIDMQSHLANVGRIGEEQMGQVTKATVDMAAYMHISLAEAGDKMAKAMNDPRLVKGFSGLGISPDKLASIKALANEGNTAVARVKLLAAIQHQVNNSAQTAYDINPLAQYNKFVERAQLAVGQFGMEILKTVKPALEWFGQKMNDAIDGVKTFMHWLNENRNTIKGVSEILGTVTLAVITFVGWQKICALWTERQAIWNGILAISEGVLEAVTGGLATVIGILNATMLANPIAAVIVGIVALIAIVYEAYENFETFHAVVWGVWGALKVIAERIAGAFSGLGEMIEGALTLNPSKIKSGYQDIVNAAKDAGADIKKAYNDNYNMGMADFKARHDKKVTAKKPEEHPHANGTPDNSDGVTRLPSASKATGTKSITINIAINKQIETLNIKTTNLTETAAKIQEHVAIALTNAVNQSQVTAGGR